ncbi:MAG TPA: hypothetical protein VMV59_07105 [Candidatus Dormibacteraeota bacterium]|nr:hypothetical protein [Candidatus Dormibacteraeota bacterium]
MKSYTASPIETTRKTVTQISIDSARGSNGANGPCAVLALDPVQFEGTPEHSGLTESAHRKCLVEIPDVMWFDSGALAWRVRRFFIPQDVAQTYLEALRFFEMAFSA